MARKKGRSIRNKMKGQPQNDDDSSIRNTTRVVLDEKILLNGTLRNLKVEDFDQAGVACPKCDFVTAKTGLSGLQAFRGHWKFHVRNRRAIVRPIMRHIGLLITSIGLAILPAKFGIEIPAKTEHVLSSERIAGDHLIPIFTAVCLALALTIVVCWNNYSISGRRKWSHRYSVSEMLSTTVLIVTATAHGLVGEVLVSWPWMSIAMAPWFASILTGSFMARVRLDVRRREFKPNYHLKLFRAKDWTTDWKITRQIRQLRQQILDGRTVWNELSRSQKRVLEKLGLGDVRPNQKKVRERLRAEQYKSQVVAKKRAEKETRDRRRTQTRQKIRPRKMPENRGPGRL